MGETLSTLATVSGTFEERVWQATNLSMADFSDAFQKKSTVKLVQVSIHNKCNLECNHCFQREDSASIDTESGFPVSAQDTLQLLQKFDSINYQRYPFPREPLLLPELIPIYEVVGCREISTNAIVLAKKPELLELLSKHGIKVVIVSLHGDEEAHCELTNSSSQTYDDLMQALRMIVARGLELEIITTLYRGNVEALDTLPRVLADIGVSKWWIQRIIPAGFAREWDIDRFIYGNECLEVMAKYAELKNRYKPEDLCIGLDLTWGPNFFSRRFLRFLAGQLQQWPWTKFACPAASCESTVISMESGRVYPCLFLETFPETQIGRLEGGGSVKEMDQSIDEQILFEKLSGLCPMSLEIQPEIFPNNSTSHHYFSHHY